MENNGKCKAFFVLALAFHLYVSWFVTKPPYYSFIRADVGKGNDEIYEKLTQNIPYTKPYELARREAKRFFWEQWNGYKNFMEAMGLSNSSDMALMREQFVETMARHDMIRITDGYDVYREAITDHVSNIIQSKIHESQNPQDCSRARKLVCYFNAHRNGWGCMVHHAAYCLMAAFASRRVLIIDKSDEMFGLDKHFMPASQTCYQTNIPPTNYDWPTMSDSEEVVRFCPNRFSKSEISNTGQFNTSMLPYLPKDLLAALVWISPDPVAWFVGQFVKYLLRPQPWLQRELEELRKHHPGPSIQVRRQDKFHESPSIEVGKYVEHVEEYFDILEATIGEPIKNKSAFVATDEPQVLTELNLRFPNIRWLSRQDTPESSILQNRYTDKGQDAVIKDVFLLAYSDFLVCTFSSNICRLAYELRFALRPFVVDLYDVVSVDISYFFQYGQEVNYIANHKRPDQTAFRNTSELTYVKGDLIRIPVSITHSPQPRHIGKNMRTNSEGHFVRAMTSRVYLSSDTYPTFL